MLRVCLFGQSGPYAPVALRKMITRQPAAWQLALVVEGNARALTPTLLPAKPRAWPKHEDLAELATATGFPVLQTCDVNDVLIAEYLKQQCIDVIVCIGFNRLFSKNLLQSVPYGGINAHPSKLPLLRGPSPIFWALRYGHKKLGVTIHAMDEYEDHGMIYAQEEWVLPKKISGEEIFRLAGHCAAILMCNTLDKLATGTLHGTPQHHALKTRAPRPTQQDALIDPMHWQCDHVIQFVEGSKYFIRPWMQLGGDAFLLQQALHAEHQRRMPAEYVEHQEYLSVQCADGIVHFQKFLDPHS